MAEAPVAIDTVVVRTDLMGTVAWNLNQRMTNLFVIFGEVAPSDAIVATLESELEHMCAHAVVQFIYYTDGLKQDCDEVSRLPRGEANTFHLVTDFGVVEWTPYAHLQQHIAACDALQVAELKMTVVAEFRRRLRAVVVSTLEALAVISPQLALRALDIEDVSQLDSALAALSL